MYSNPHYLYAVTSIFSNSLFIQIQFCLAIYFLVIYTTRETVSLGIDRGKNYCTQF